MTKIIRAEKAARSSWNRRHRHVSQPRFKWYVHRANRAIVAGMREGEVAVTVPAPRTRLDEFIDLYKGVGYRVSLSCWSAADSFVGDLLWRMEDSEIPIEISWDRQFRELRDGVAMADGE